MSNFHHKPIRRFGFQGKIYDDAQVARLRQEYRKIILLEMTMSGYVPRLDIPEDFTLEYDYRTEYFNFKISIHGIYVGKKQSKWIIGVDGTEAIYTTKSKLDEFSQGQV